MFPRHSVETKRTQGDLKATARGKRELASEVAEPAGFFRANPPTDTGTVATPAVHNVDAGVAIADGIDVNEPQITNVVAQADGTAKLIRPANVLRPSGGRAYTGQGYLNSGFIAAGESFAAAIDAPPGTYDYLCLLHATETNYNMRGTIAVTQ